MWLFLVLAVFALVQLWVARKVNQAEDGPDPEEDWEPPPGAFGGIAHPDGDPSEGTGSTVVCPNCGTENGAGFDYCRECATALPA